MDRRLIAIEEKIAHLEHHLGQLDGVVRDLNDRLDGFKGELTRLHTAVQQQAQSGGIGGGDDSGGAGGGAGGGGGGGGGDDEQLKDGRPPHW